MNQNFTQLVNEMTDAGNPPKDIVIHANKLGLGEGKKIGLVDVHSVYFESFDSADDYGNNVIIPAYKQLRDAGEPLTGIVKKLNQGGYCSWVDNIFGKTFTADSLFEMVKYD